MLTWKLMLVFIAMVLFILAAFGVSFLGLSLGWVGLAFFAASTVVNK